MSTSLNSTLTSLATTITSASATLTSTAPSSSSSAAGPLPGSGQKFQGQTLVSFAGALGSGLVIFAIQLIAFLLLKEKLARIL